MRRPENTTAQAMMRAAMKAERDMIEAYAPTLTDTQSIDATVDGYINGQRIDAYLRETDDDRKLEDAWK